ncbi:hypothetical protein [Helicobacter cinaedi]|nr:hypothetical protein [Helicobacter cinaedi]
MRNFSLAVTLKKNSKPNALNSLKDKAKPTSKEIKESIGLCSV